MMTSVGACLLSACGGGSAGGVESAPVTVVTAPVAVATPTPTPTATPTPTPIVAPVAPVPTTGTGMVTMPAGSPLAVTPELLIPDAIVAQGERVARVRVLLSQAARRPLAWKCLTANGTAYSGTYYDTTSATVMFRPGETEKVVEVPIKRDLGGTTLQLNCAWPQMYPTIAGRAGVIRQATARPDAADAVSPSYPAVQRQSGRSLAFASTFQEKVTPVIEKGTWRSRFGWGRVQTGNKEIAPYTDATTDAGVNPHPVVDGKRVLRAEYVPTKDAGTGLSYNFSASLLDSANIFTFQYGYIELRAKLSIAQGTVGAFWLLPASGKWPPEVDIGEFNLGDNGAWASTIHIMEGDKKSGEGLIVPRWAEDGQWHTIGFDWTREWQVTFVDGVDVVRRPNVFNEPMKMVLDVSVGGLGPDPKNPQPGWKNEIALEYLKVWR